MSSFDSDSKAKIQNSSKVEHGMTAGRSSLQDDGIGNMLQRMKRLVQIVKRLSYRFAVLDQFFVDIATVDLSPDADTSLSSFTF